MLLQVSLHREPPEVGLVEKLTKICISGGNSMCQPYIESATTLSDNTKPFIKKEMLGWDLNGYRTL